MEKVVSYDTVASLGFLDELYDDGRDMSSLLGEMATLFRDLLVFKLSPGSGLISAGFDHTDLSALSGKITPERLFYCLDILKTAISGLTRGGSSKLAVEMCLIKMCDERLSDDLAALLSRISRLENVEKVLTYPVNRGDSKESETTDISLTAEVNSVAAKDIQTETTYEPGDFWQTIVESLKSEPPVYALISNSSKVKAELDGSVLVINVADSFTANMINNEFYTLLKETANKVLGHDVFLRIEEGGIKAEEVKRSKLDDLSSFGILNIE